MFERFTRAARDVVVHAQEEATALGHEHVGTEHLLLALSALDAGVAGGVLRALRVDHDALRDEVIALLGPDRLDADALATIGIDLDQVRRSVEASFGTGALSRRRGCRRGARGGFRPLTPRAKRALELALREALALGDRQIGSEHILLGLTADPASAAAAALRRVGAPPDSVRAATLAALRRAA